MAARRALESIRIFKGPVGFVIHHGNDTKWMWEREGGGKGGGSGAKCQFRIVKNCYVQNLNYSVPHEESRKMFFVHFASFLQNQMSYGHVLCTIMIPYLP